MYIGTATVEGKKVLIVDDDYLNIRLIERILKDEKVNVVIARNGAEALRRLTEHPDIDLVFMNIKMPVMDGYMAMRIIRTQVKFIELPIVVVTADSLTGSQRYLRSGASDYLVKPLNREKVYNVLDTWLTPVLH